jgi:hypothetical protein
VSPRKPTPGEDPTTQPETYLFQGEDTLAPSGDSHGFLPRFALPETLQGLPPTVEVWATVHRAEGWRWDDFMAPGFGVVRWLGIGPIESAEGGLHPEEPKGWRPMGGGYFWKPPAGRDAPRDDAMFRYLCDVHSGKLEVTNVHVEVLIVEHHTGIEVSVGEAVAKLVELPALADDPDDRVVLLGCAVTEMNLVPKAMQAASLPALKDLAWGCLTLAEAVDKAREGQPN